MSEKVDISWDVFISYASEDRADVAEPLAQGLGAEGLEVWYDQSELKLGDSLRERIDDGLARCRFGVVILSESFFCKHFPRRELQGLTQREVNGRKVVLPVWHGLTAERVRQFSPPLGDKLAADTVNGIPSVVQRIVSVVRGESEQLAEPAGDCPILFASSGRSAFRQALDEFSPPGSLRDILNDW